MKRLLSLILALALVAGMVPATFATGTEENVVWSPKYIFNADQIEDSSGQKATSVLFSDLAGYKVSDTSESADWKFVSGHNLWPNAQATTTELTFYTQTKTPDNDNACVLTISVDKSGIYVPSFTFDGVGTQDGIIDIYLFNKRVAEEKKWDMSESVFISQMVSAGLKDTYAEVKYIASYDRRKDSTRGIADYVMNPVAIEAGDNYVVLVINEPTPQTENASSTPTDRTYGGIKTLTLTCSATITATQEYTKEEYEVGDSFAIVSSTTDGSGNSTTQDVTNIAYSTSNKRVATVDSTGNVTVNGRGNAVITVEATVGENRLVDKIDISVPAVWSPVYNFTQSAFTTQPTNESGTATWTGRYATDASLLNREVSTGAWTYAAGGTQPNGSSFSNMNIYDNEITKDNLNLYVSATENGLNAYVLNINVPISGHYRANIDYHRQTKAAKVDFYLVSKTEFDKRNGWEITDYSDTVNSVVVPMRNNTTKYVDTKLLGSVEEYINAETDTVDTNTQTYTGDSHYIEAGDYYLFISGKKGGATADSDRICNRIYVKQITLKRQPTVETTASKTTLAVGDSATLTSEVTSGENQDITATTEVTYTSSDLNVAQIENGNEIKAVGEGTAIITATAANGATDTVEIKVEAKKISLAYTTSVDEENIVVEAHKAGSVTVNAPEKTGYTFSHWVRGTADNGVWVSTDASYKFDLVSPTYLTAIYVEDGAKIVEFFNGNGELLAQKEVVDGKVEEPAEPKMVGFTFLNWILGKNGNEAIPFVNENIEKSLRVVADYAVESTKYTVDDDSNLVYDAEVVKNADSEDTVWYRGGSPVGYGKTYTYNVWANTTITSDTLTGEKTPLVYLDTAVKNVGDEKACMIEFDGAGKEIVEVGILFSTTGTPEVGSCQYKATSKTNGGDDGHGQFTAKPANNTQTVARGYIIYLDNGEYKTEYSEVLGLND